MFKPVRYINNDFASIVKKDVSRLKVLRDTNGFFVGRTYSHKPMGIIENTFARYSEYFETKEEAKDYLPIAEEQSIKSKEAFKKYIDAREQNELRQLKNDDIDYEEWKEMKTNQEKQLNEETIKVRPITVNGEETYVSEIEVLRSNAGHYIGRQYIDVEMSGQPEEGETLLDIGVWVPYDRISEEYFKNYESAQKALETGNFTLRSNSPENNFDEQIKEYYEKVKNNNSKYISSDIDTED